MNSAKEAHSSKCFEGVNVMKDIRDDVPEGTLI